MSEIEEKIINPKLRIGFTGGQGSGKTTLSKYIIAKYKFRHSYLNQTRKHIITTYKGDLELARKNNLQFQKALIKRKMYWETRHQKSGFVTDRTTLDNIAYFLAFNPKDEDKDVVLKYITSGVTHAKSSYDLIFCLPPLLSTPNDPLSPPNTIDKFKIYYIICGLLKTIQDPNTVHYIYTMNLDQRKAIIDNLIMFKLKEF